MPNYRIEALLRHPEKDHEDELEKQILTKLYEIDGKEVQIVAFIVRPS